MPEQQPGILFQIITHFSICLDKACFVLLVLPSFIAVLWAQSLVYQAYQTAPQQKRPDNPPISSWFNQRHTAHWPIKTQPPGTQQQPGIQGVVVIIVHNLRKERAEKHVWFFKEYVEKYGTACLG